ncbi:hypothetical protein GQF03_08105 [Sneathiella chungangensis]|uniref:CopG family transcriptional regulator n=1 Tax=Sneathiella chungangensis TaxID=1418234 RepID=A0A845MFS3_9PROT|nr:hypothetical protein [Sneathiella chungangensis]MZR22290.1 hypothetical protein [Sneathiella chungangensis]
MPAEKKRKKKERKDSQLIIRIKGKERDQFVALCEELDTSAAREVRRFIRDFLKQHAASD